MEWLLEKVEESTKIPVIGVLLGAIFLGLLFPILVIHLISKKITGQPLAENDLTLILLMLPSVSIVYAAVTGIYLLIKFT